MAEREQSIRNSLMSGRGRTTGHPEVLYKGMSSEKNFSLSWKPELFSLHPAHHNLLSFFLQLLDRFDSSRSAPAGRGATRSRCFSPIPIVSCSLFMTAPFGSLKLVSKGGCRVANHGPIGDSWPIAFLGHAREHRVILETRCRSTQIA